MLYPAVKVLRKRKYPVRRLRSAATKIETLSALTWKRRMPAGTVSLRCSPRRCCSVGSSAALPGSRLWILAGTPAAASARRTARICSPRPVAWRGKPSSVTGGKGTWRAFSPFCIARYLQSRLGGSSSPGDGARFGPLYTRPRRSVAQLARAPVSKTGGWGFESLHSCHAQVLPRHWFSRAATFADEVFALPRPCAARPKTRGKERGWGFGARW